ncbi:MAG: hypothetical protein F6K28_13815 [Microcoleus sp. SIO2G3]|nr:hypothetical protein [Microcoleus sp. SIO2G3]
MAEPLDAPLDRSEPLGIKNPLLPPRTLGQTEPNLQFMLPLGARPLAVLDPSIFFPEGGSEYAEIGQSFAESPFFDTSDSTSYSDNSTERIPTAVSQNTPIQRQTVSLDSPAPLPLENQLIRVQEQQAQVHNVNVSEPTRLTGANVDSPSLPDEPIADGAASSEVTPTADLEASIQRSQVSSEEPPLPAQTASEQTSLSGTRASFQTSPSDSDPPQPGLKRAENSSATDTSLQTRLASSQSEAAVTSSAQSPSVEASTGTTDPVTEVLQGHSRLGEAPAISTESREETQTSQPDVTSSVSESAIASTIQRQAIPEQSQNDERQEVEAILDQTNLPQEVESSTLRQPTEGAIPLSESPHYQQPSQPPIQNITELEDSATSLLSSDSQSQETPQSIAPIIQASVSPLEQAVQPKVLESSIAEPQAEALTDLPRQANTANVSPSTPNPPETTGNPTLVEPVQDAPTTSPELTTPTEQETIQPRFESASPQSEITASPLLNLPSEALTEVSHQSVEFSSPEIVQRAAESVQEPTDSQLPTTGDQVEKVRSHSPLEHPLPSPAPSSDAVLPTTPNPDSPSLGLELTPSAAPQDTSPLASAPTAETEAVVQPQLESALDLTSVTPASTPELGSLPDTSEVVLPTTPDPDSPPSGLELTPSVAPQDTPPLASVPIAETEAVVQPRLESALDLTSVTPASTPELGSLADTSEAVLPTTPNPDSPLGLELTPSAAPQDASPLASIPTAETEAVVQPQLESALDLTSVTPASTTGLGSLPDTSEVVLPTTPNPNSPPSGLELATSATTQDTSPAASVQPQLESSPPPLTEVDHVSSKLETLTGEVENTTLTAEPQQSDSSQEVAEQAIAPNLASEPSTLNPPLVASEPTLDSQDTVLNNEQPTPTEALTFQPRLESTTVQRQVTDTPALDQPVSNPQSIIQAKEADFTDLQTAPEISRELSSQSNAIGEATVQRETKDAIAPATDSSSATNSVSPFTTEETPTSVLHTQPTDGLTATEPDLIQPFQPTTATSLNQLPTLPTVLQDLSVLNPLRSTPLIQTASLVDTASAAEPVPVIARKQSNVFDNAESGVEQFPTSLPPQSILQTAPISSNTGAVADVPTEWSSIAELLNGNSFSVPSPSAQASPPFPDLQPFGSTETVIQPQFESATRRNSADTLPAIQTDEEQSNVTEVTSETQAPADASPEQLEKLAREIYSLVRQRFKIEQERSGNSYSGRLPW